MPSYNPLANIADQSASIDVNGTAYSWKDIDVKFLGKSTMYIQSIEWKEDEDASFDTGAGQVGKYLGVGNRKVTGSMEIGLSEFMGIAAAAAVISPLCSPLDIPPFTISITYYSRIGDVKFTNIFNVKFISDGGVDTQGNTHLYRKLDFIAASIQNK